MKPLKLSRHIVACLQFSFYTVVFLLVVFGVLSVLHLCNLVRKIQLWKRSNIPYLRPIFWYGQQYFYSLRRYSQQFAIDRIYRENEDKGLVAFFMGRTPVVLLRDTTLMKQVLWNSADKAYQHGWRIWKDDLVAQSAIHLSSDQKEWKNSRGIMAPVFTTSWLHGAPEFAKITKQVDKLLSFVEKLDIEPVNADVVPLYFCVDAYSLFGLGVDADSFHKEGGMYELVDATRFRDSFLTKIRRFCMTDFPALQFFDVFRVHSKPLRDFFKKYLTEQMAHREENNLHHNDILDRFISLKQKGSTEFKEENADDLLQIEEALNIKRLIGYCASFLLPGCDSAALSVTHLLHLLSLHPEFQDKIKEEIDEVMGHHRVTEFTPDVIKDLHFTEQCLLESQRLFPAIGYIIRRCTEDIQIPGTPYTINKGDTIMLSPHSVHRDPKYFNNPDKFDPNRFSPQNRGSITPEMFLSYGYGPKKCPAYKQGNFVALICTAALVHKYEIRPHSHFKQLELEDMDPASPFNNHTGDLLIKLIRRKVATAQT